MGGAAVPLDVPVPAVLVGEGAEELGAAEVAGEVIDAVLAVGGSVCKQTNKKVHLPSKKKLLFFAIPGRVRDASSSGSFAKAIFREKSPKPGIPDARDFRYVFWTVIFNQFGLFFLKPCLCRKDKAEVQTWQP